ncbi:nucleic acid/nucleotide deaminase of polymorphic system toxin [Saccharothrix carnea]|uniref:Nucleic acid/nucleotide deaminase of polymorphic system toxin n=1 Tax=Saccharothrix carnea TaxID=1280637 RepID=A0A2P8I9N1_SACCR|nr:DddA-like double-stranded DNA deaminase toxin [Saccharothrix carnea]PSL55183.1 nucleic acid/nucleotide deaminase of polymorphic system toxin [Saccharothrix carnea]
MVAALRQAVKDLPFTPLADALDLAEDAKALIELAATGSGQDEFLQVVARFDEVVNGIGELQKLLTTIQQTATAAASRLEGAAAPQTVTPQPKQTEPNQPAAAQPDSPKPPDRVRELLSKLPVRDSSNQKTHGYWLDGQGNAHGPLPSGRDELSEAATAELRRLGIAPSRGALMTADHVEVKLAVSLRASPEQEVTVVINNDPCARGPFSCDRLLPRILRPNQVVTVYWPGGVKTYRGRAV